ncbi:hypothetical protein L1987_34013 [Smallanthus sonchifolius]|uniref:Uncharacterized protein n=1 Tax=Smallanthus sonchifolius TaxID=185202 RepID=A0ACB9HSM6_9ASTR|nr:hypothetical protein L1987_34013 [Smallanthus sonchifolius]
MNTRNMFILFIAMVVLTTQSSARVFPTRSLVDTNDDVAIREEDLQTFYDSLMNYLNLESTAVNGENVLVGSISPANAPEPTPVPEPSHKHHHKHDHDHDHDHEEHHHKHEHEHHHHKHEHKDHHHKHNEPQALPPTTPTSAPTPTQSLESFLTWI